MKGSYTKFNYELRTAKAIERKMIIEVFKQLSRFLKLEDYRYVGFGSIFFKDFKLFHKGLGITDMISIERDIDHFKRFEFNRPYNCIELKMGDSGEVLLELNWDKKNIIWLDYDDALKPYMFEDIATVFTRMNSGSIFFMTCNYSFPEYSEKPGEYKFDLFKKDFEEHKKVMLNLPEN